MGAELDTLKTSLKNLIVTSLAKRYVSISSHMDYKTGNAYQSLILDGEQTIGYRGNRERLFARFNLTGKTVLDCGCNLGELSRLARRAGAELVDGIEYDDFFVYIGRLVNAYTGTDRVSIRQGDLTQRGTIKGVYDVSLAFSVFPYIIPNLDELASCTREALIVETHNVTADLVAIYIDPLVKYFPHYTYVGRTDFGKGEEGDRAVFAMAKSSVCLSKAGLYDASIDLENSTFDFLDPIRRQISLLSTGPVRSLDDLRKIVDSQPEAFGDAHLVTAGRDYWITMIQGYLDYKGHNDVEERNCYSMLLRKIMNEVNFDPVLRDRLSSSESLKERVLARFRDADRILDDTLDNIHAVRIIMHRSYSHIGRYHVAISNSDDVVTCDYLDGYHRIFWANITGRKNLPAIITY